MEEAPRVSRALFLLPVVGAVLVIAGLRIFAQNEWTPGVWALGVSAALLLLFVFSLFRLVHNLGGSQLSGGVVNEAELSPLREERMRVLRAIKELDFDFSLGKLSKADYEAVIQPYKLRAIELNRQLKHDDELHPQLQRELNPDSMSERTESSSELSECSKCQTLNDLDAKFCKECGAAVVEGPRGQDSESKKNLDTTSNEELSRVD